METISHNNKEYTKASELARAFRYTPDYVGQLCRAGKLDARLVGRTWYVTRDSLVAHKNNRYQDKTAVNVSRSSREVSSLSLAKQRVPAFYLHVHERSSPSTYEPDDSILYPNVASEKSGSGTKLSVDLAGATELSVDSKSEHYAFESAERSEPVFKGDLVVASLEEFSDYIEPKEKHHMKHDESEDAVSKVNVTSVEKNGGYKIAIEEQSTARNTSTPTINEVTTQSHHTFRDRLAEREVLYNLQVVDSSPVVASVDIDTSQLSYWLVVSAMTLALTIVSTSLLLQQKVTVSSQNISQSYQLDISPLQRLRDGITSRAEVIYSQDAENSKF